MISGWWKTDNDNTQPESLSVSSPPRPDSLPVSAEIWLLNLVTVSVTVKVIQSESGIRAAPKKTSGLPKSVRPCARRSDSAQDRPLTRGLGASVIDPVEKSAACDPVVTSTRSSGPTATEAAAPSRSYSSRLTVILLGDGAKPMSRTKVPFRKFTQRGRSQA